MATILTNGGVVFFAVQSLILSSFCSSVPLFVQPCFVFPFFLLYCPLYYFSSSLPYVLPSLFFFSTPYVSSLLLSPSVHCFSLAFIGQRIPRGGKGWLLIRMQSGYSLKACPITDAIQHICCRKHLSFYCWKRLPEETMNNVQETTPFQNSNRYFWFGNWFFCNFVIKPSIKIIIGSLDFSVFFGLVLGFRLFQLSL